MKNLSYFILLSVLVLLSACKDDPVCNDGYEGSDCTTEISPRIVIAKQLILSNVPSFRPDSTPWDSIGNALPDCLIEIDMTGFSSTIVNMSELDEAVFDLNNYQFNSDEQTVISVYENDSDPMGSVVDVELIATFAVPVYTPGEAFPETVSFGDSPQITINLEYEW